MALRALQFWRDFYHVDGFHVLGEGFNREMLLRDGILSGAKLIFQGFDFDHFTEEISGQTLRSGEQYEFSPGYAPFPEKR